jgi:putative radical SAM enzyme (TIGR03279 family)
MKNQIAVVESGSIAEEMEIEVGDCLLSINGKIVKDIIDYRFLICDEYVDVEIKKNNGEIWELEIEKEYDEKLGIQFRDAIMDKPKSCHNKCIFCFIDQLPKGMRKTLYFKDDDSRLAFLQGNFVTLTNMNEEDIDRIIKYKISPINISVHTTNPELRIKMINNRFAGNVYDRLKKLAAAGISLNCQIVLCPGINDGEELEKTIEDLYKLYPNVENLAVVPVGVTKYREGLYDLKLYDKNTAGNQLGRVSRLQSKYMNEIGKPFVRLSDEFYVLAERDVPSSDFYDGFGQLEDGVGIIRVFRNAIENSIKDLRLDIKGSFTMVTGVSAYEEILKGAKRISSLNSKIDISVKKIINNFFGHTITVAGLITGGDIIQQLKEDELGDCVIIPDVMLRKGYELASDTEKIFLDDITVEELSKQLNRKIIVCDFSGEDLINIINEHCCREE